MAKFIKHVGVNNNGKKVVVVFREVPNDQTSALVIPTESLPQLYHDDLMKAIESSHAQDSADPSEFLFRQVFHDGTNMLNTIHQKGWMIKVPAKSIMMVPKPGVEINLVDLNRELSQIERASNAKHGINHGATRSGDIANGATPSNPPGVIDDEALAAKYRAQANTFEAEARHLREEAAKLDPKGSLSVLTQDGEVKKGRGRPAKVKVVA
jgi:hypothetical protein